MTRLEKVGLFVGIPGSLITIFSILPDYNQILALIMDLIVYLYFMFISFLAIIKELFLMDIPLLFMIALFLSGFIVYRNRSNINIAKVYNKLSPQEQKILNIIIVYNENRSKCTYNRILREIKQRKLKFSNLETNSVTKQLLTKNLIYKQEVFMDENHYLLTERGQEIGIQLIKESQKND